MPPIHDYISPVFGSDHYVSSIIKRIDETEDRLEIVKDAFQELTLLQGEKGDPGSDADATAAIASLQTTEINPLKTSVLSLEARATILETHTSNYILVEGESTVSNDVLWSCGASAPIVEFGIPVPYKSVLFRTSGISYGSHGSLTRMTLDVNNYGLTGGKTFLKTLEFNLVTGSGFMNFMEAVPKSMENLIENGGNFLSFSDVKGYNTLGEEIAIPSSLRFRIVLEIFKDEYTSGYIDPRGGPGGGITLMSGCFGGTFITNGNTLTFPNVAEVWAGFFNLKNDIYPIYLINGGQITFTGKVTTDTEAVITFKLEDVPNPNTTTEVYVSTTITNTTDSYTIAIPSQGSTAFNVFLMYTPIGSTVEITDVRVVGSL